ncbi:unnamed protein product [Sphagnum balticum]
MCHGVVHLIAHDAARITDARMLYRVNSSTDRGAGNFSKVNDPDFWLLHFGSPGKFAFGRRTGWHNCAIVRLIICIHMYPPLAQLSLCTMECLLRATGDKCVKVVQTTIVNEHFPLPRGQQLDWWRVVVLTLQ